MAGVAAQETDSDRLDQAGRPDTCPVWPAVRRRLPPVACPRQKSATGGCKQIRWNQWAGGALGGGARAALVTAAPTSAGRGGEFEAAGKMRTAWWATRKASLDRVLCRNRRAWRIVRAGPRPVDWGLCCCPGKDRRYVAIDCIRACFDRAMEEEHTSVWLTDIDKMTDLEVKKVLTSQAAPPHASPHAPPHGATTVLGLVELTRSSGQWGNYRKCEYLAVGPTGRDVINITETTSCRA